MTAQTILPANTLSSGYDVANSLSFYRAIKDSIFSISGCAGY